MFYSLLRLLLLFLLLPAADAAPLSISAESTAVNARPAAAYYDDRQGELTLDALLAQPRLFTPAGQHRPDPGAQRHWIRLPLKNDGATAGQWLLTLGVPDAEWLEVFQVDAAGSRTLLRLPADAPFTARPLPTRLLAVPISLAAGDSANSAADIFLRYRTHANTPLSLELMSSERYFLHLSKANLVNGALVGLLLALTLLALLQYLVTSHQAFLAYSLMALLMIAFVLQFEGYNFGYLWPNQGAWNQYAPILLAAGIQAMQALFAISLFDLRRRHPGLYRLYLIYLTLLPLTLPLFIFAQWTWPALLVGLLYVPLVCGAGIFLIRQGGQVAGFFLAGAVGNALFSNLLFGLSVFSLAGTANPFIYPKIGYLCEAIFFAVALAHQLRTLQRQVEISLRRHLAEAEQLARSEADKHRALLAAQERQLQLAATGHDLSQPLAAIRLGLTALRVSGANEAATRHIDQALDFTEALLQGLVAEAKAELAAQPQNLSLEDLLAQTRERHRAAAQGKGLALHYHPTARRLHGSPLILARILDNLVSNAIRYTPHGRVLLGVRWRRDGLEIQVRDSGPGIDLARRQQLLAPFAQSGKRSEERHGHGLGLYIVHSLCAQSGYRLLIDARPGRGSTFGIFVPA